MRARFLADLIFLLPFLLAACAPGASGTSSSQPMQERTFENKLIKATQATQTAVIPKTKPTQDIKKESIVLPINLYIMAGQNDSFASNRAKSELEQLYSGIAGPDVLRPTFDSPSLIRGPKGDNF